MLMGFIIGWNLPLQVAAIGFRYGPRIFICVVSERTLLMIWKAQAGRANFIPLRLNV
jgi:hypothetical protein